MRKRKKKERRIVEIASEGFLGGRRRGRFLLIFLLFSTSLVLSVSFSFAKKEKEKAPWIS
jgi:hypothetical protein